MRRISRDKTAKSAAEQRRRGDDDDDDGQIDKNYFYSWNKNYILFH